MSDESELTKILIDSLGKEVYQDLLQPATKRLGQSLLIVSDTIDICTYPIQALNWTGKNVKKWAVENIAKRLADVPSEQLISPNRQIFTQAANGLNICFDDLTLREMFANLMSASLCSETEDYTHPSFPNIIQQLSSYEAALLSYLFKNFHSDIIIKETTDYSEGELSYSDYLEGALHSKKSEFTDMVKISLALDNFIRLRLLFATTTFSSEYIGERAEKHEIISPKVEQSYEIEIGYTALGFTFLECCVKNGI